MFLCFCCRYYRIFFSVGSSVIAGIYCDSETQPLAQISLLKFQVHNVFRYHFEEDFLTTQVKCQQLRVVTERMRMIEKKIKIYRIQQLKINVI